MCQIASDSRRARSTWATLAALAAQPGLGAPVTLGVNRVAAAWTAASISAQRRYFGSFLASGPRWSFAAGLVDPRA